MAQIEGIRSCYELVGGIVHFGRMLDKIRLHQSGKLPPDYVKYLGDFDGTQFDGRVCRFLRIDFGMLCERVARGGTDDEILIWAQENGRTPTETQILVFNGFLSKRGWRDPASKGLTEVLVESGFAPDAALTFFDYNDIDEGRPLRFPHDPPKPSFKPNPSVHLEGLRSPYDKVGGVVHFGRMLDKIRLQENGALPKAWGDLVGAKAGFDGLCCQFLGIDFAELKKRLLDGASDEKLVEWAFQTGGRSNEEELFIWNTYMEKRAWRDSQTERLHFRLQEAGLPIGAALTMFDYIELDEGRQPRY